MVGLKLSQQVCIYLFVTVPYAGNHLPLSGNGGISHQRSAWSLTREWPSVASSPASDHWQNPASPVFRDRRAALFAAQETEVTVKLDLTGLTDGQEAGLTAQKQTAGSRCRPDARRTKAVADEQARIDCRPVLTATNLWLRSTWGVKGFEFSANFDS